MSSISAFTGASAAAAAGAGAGAAASSATTTSSAYPLALPLVAVCSEYLTEDPEAVCGLWETMQVIVPVENRAGYCFGAYVARRLQSREGLTELSKWKFVVETAVYATRRGDFRLLDRALGTMHQNSPSQSRLCEFADTNSYYRLSQWAVATCERRGWEQLRFLEGGQKVLALQRFSTERGPQQQGTRTERELGFSLAISLIIRHLEDAEFVVSIIARFPPAERSRLLCVMSIAAACRGLSSLTFPRVEIPENVQKEVNEILGAANLSLKVRIERIQAIFKPLLSAPLPLCDLYEHFPILQALLRENLVKDVSNLQEVALRDPRLEVLQALAAYPPFMAFILSPFNKVSYNIDDVFKAAAEQEQWDAVAYVIEQAESLNLPISQICFCRALDLAVLGGNAEAVSLLMEYEVFKNLTLEEVHALTLRAAERGSVGVTFLLLRSPQMQQASVEDFSGLLTGLAQLQSEGESHPEMLKMFLEDARILKFNKGQLMTVIMRLLIGKNELPLFKSLAEHPVFKVLTKTEIEIIFRQIRTVEHFAILKATGRVEELAIQVVYERMLSLIDQSAVVFLQALFLTPQFSRFEVGQLNALYTAIVAKRDPQLLTAFMASSRFKDIDALTLGQELVKAVKMERKDLVEIMVKSPHLRKLSAESRTDALLEAGKLQNGKEAMIALLTLLVPV